MHKIILFSSNRSNMRDLKVKVHITLPHLLYIIPKEISSKIQTQLMFHIVWSVICTINIIVGISEELYYFENKNAN